MRHSTLLDASNCHTVQALLLCFWHSTVNDGTRARCTLHFQFDKVYTIHRGHNNSVETFFKSLFAGSPGKLLDFTSK